MMTSLKGPPVYSNVSLEVIIGSGLIVEVGLLLSVSIFLIICSFADTTIAELIKHVTDKPNFLHQVYTEQRELLSVLISSCDVLQW